VASVSRARVSCHHRRRHAPSHLAVVLTVAMFTHVAATAVISSSFLLILGYFFGQTVARESSREANG
jgi:hypothetical protein